MGQKLGNALTANRGLSVHVAEPLAIDRYQAAERVQFRVIDVAQLDEEPALTR